jgi:hypothetical protein
MRCRFCKSELTHPFIDLFNCPPSNSFLNELELNSPEVFYPLQVYTCSECFLVQIDEYKKSDSIFSDQYVYFSSYSTSYLQHAQQYAKSMVERFAFNSKSQVIEIASNDGYLLQYFKEKNIPVLGVEPTVNTANAARKKGIDSINEFFGETLAKRMVSENIKADLLIGNNVLAHVPDIVDFVKGMKLVLKETGVITLEFPHLLQLITNNQFDTIYHEHYSYLSFYTVSKIFESLGLEMFDVQEISTHGGSLRVFARHKDDQTKPVLESVQAMLEKEISTGLTDLSYYDNFQQRAFKAKLDLTEFLIYQKIKGKKVAAYGAAAKGNTLLNYCGIKNDLIDFIVDLNPHKQNKWLPGSHIKVVDESYLKREKPDFVILFAWNLKEEIMQQISYINEWEGSFVLPIPSLEVVSLNKRVPIDIEAIFNANPKLSLGS